MLVAALAGALALAATTAQAQTGGGTPPAPAYFPVTVHSPKPQQQGRWSERVKVAGDLNHDGINDFWVGVPRYQRDDPNDQSPPQTYGRVYAVDGYSLSEPLGQKKYPKIIYKIHYPEPQLDKQFGFQIENIGDVNEDGIAEIAAGTDAQNVPVDQKSNNTQKCDLPNEKDEPECFENMGKAWVFDGKTNRVLYELNNPRPQGSPNHRARFGSRLGKAGDINGDGASEVIVGASGNDNPEEPGCSDDGLANEPGCRREQGQAFIFDGKTGALVRELNLPKEDQPTPNCQSLCGGFGFTVQGPGDVSGDGVPDQVVAAPSLNVEGRPGQGRMYVFDGDSGRPVDDQPIRRIDDPQPQPIAFFGFEDVTPLDPGDITGDGRAEIYGHGFFQAGEGGNNQGKSWVFNVGDKGPEPTKEPMYEVQNPNRRACQSFGWSMTRERNRVASPPIADGEDESNPLYVGNDPHHCQGDQRGETNTFSALTGAHEQTLPLPPPWAAELGVRGNLGPNLGWTTASPGDLNRDGFRDFVGGAPFTDVCHIRLGTTNKELHENQGVMIAFVSNPDNEPPPPNDQNPADNVCSDDNPPDNPQSG